LDEWEKNIDKVSEAANEHHQVHRKSDERYDQIQKGLDEVLVYLRDELGVDPYNDPYTDSDSDSDSEPEETPRLQPLSSSDCVSSELACLTDCHSLSSYKSGQAIDRNADPAAKKNARSWSSTDPRTTSSLVAFFKHYFLSDKKYRPYWTPNRKKTKDPIILYGVTDIKEIHTLAKRVNKLHVCSAGAPPNRVVVLGWDRAAVWLRASEFSTTAYSDDVCRYIFDTARRFAKAMQGQHDGLRLNKADNWTNNAFQGTLDHFQGSYLVRWKDVDGGWDVRAVLGLEVGMGPRKRILEATLRFPGAEETMLLAHSFETLDTYLDGSLKENGEDGDGRGGKSGNAKGEKTGDNQDERSDGEPRLDTHDKTVELDSADHEKPVKDPELDKKGNPITAAPKPMADPKPPRGTMGNPMEFNFIAELCYRVVGRTAEGCRGRLHWTADQTFTSFTGNGFLPYLGSRVEMEGFEI
jgi:hypothetical protein